MKKLLAFFGATVFLFGAGRGYSEEKPNVGQLSSAFNTLSESLSLITNVELFATTITHLGENFAPSQQLRQFDGKIHYVIGPEGYYFETESLTMKGKTAFKEVAFDGKRFQLFDKNRGTLIISDAEGQVDMLGPRNVFFKPYFPFIKAWQKNEHPQPPTLSDLSSVDSWVGSVEADSIEKVEFEDKDCVTFNVKGDENITYRVWLSVGDSYFPIKWEQLTASGKTAASFTVKKVGKLADSSGNSVFFPEEFVGIDFDDESEGNILTSFEATVTSIKLNELASPERYTIDPSSADRIFDSSTNTVITVPK